jgi:FKBP-type peptidyl-prolyl cis-trans isomerase FkpA
MHANGRLEGMRALSIFLPTLFMPGWLLAQTPAAPPAAAGMTDEQKTIYALGVELASSISGFNLTPAEIELVKKGLTDGLAGKPAVSLDVQGPKVQPLYIARVKAASDAYLAKAAAQPGAVKTASGLIYKEDRAGTGASPKATDRVLVNYRGTLVNGTEFDSSYKRNKPEPLGLNMVIPCWTEAVQRMKVGGKATLTCPSSIAYGDRGSPPVIPGGATLIFEIELLEINPPPAPAK